MGRVSTCSRSILIPKICFSLTFLYFVFTPRGVNFFPGMFECSKNCKLSTNTYLPLGQSVKRFPLSLFVL